MGVSEQSDSLKRATSVYFSLGQLSKSWAESVGDPRWQNVLRCLLDHAVTFERRAFSDGAGLEISNLSVYRIGRALYGDDTAAKEQRAERGADWQIAAEGTFICRQSIADFCRRTRTAAPPCLNVQSDWPIDNDVPPECVTAESVAHELFVEECNDEWRLRDAIQKVKAEADGPENLRRARAEGREPDIVDAAARRAASAHWQLIGSHARSEIAAPVPSVATRVADAAQPPEAPQPAEAPVRAGPAIKSDNKRRRPSRLNPIWNEAEPEIDRWLEENGIPQAGDENQTRLEKYTAGWLGDREVYPAESTIRAHVTKRMQIARTRPQSA
jgi:hypothetical protein